eukprot:2717961-Pyramimonas_sp.AAC.1
MSLRTEEHELGDSRRTAASRHRATVGLHWAADRGPPSGTSEAPVQNARDLQQSARAKHSEVLARNMFRQLHK